MKVEKHQEPPTFTVELTELEALGLREALEEALDDRLQLGPTHNNIYNLWNLLNMRTDDVHSASSRLAGRTWVLQAQEKSS